jgi:[ribosomal protein S5]-alanine N-acetyltransferase
LIVLKTERLTLRQLTSNDAPFILELLNEEGFLRYIGDKGVRDLNDARDYIAQGPVDSYERNGFGLYASCLKDGVAIGICGLVKRDTLPDPDLGFAFLSRYGCQGYAVESARAVMAFGRDRLKLPRIVAITSPDNIRSIAVLEKVGLKFDRYLNLKEGAPSVRLFT